ncbi:DNA polymerase III subunit delta' [Methylibium sp. Root1272]|uniref:DNA polymerase III subunit delta' n=1 Tax=Methylibium sp. Root1272 TaxID=1736441 RepID=UPI0006FC97A7|nr:DNA polymerase III subunit delta' [Methylibium sp. Root1272]KQW76577.1 DNA polymerase III subunit delta' [Methylibium sp. Root1272]
MSAGPDDGLLPWLEAPLAQALHGTRGHALLLHGMQGVGQFELALAAAAAWLCEGDDAAARPGGRACLVCTACRLIAARTHPDLMVLIPEALQEALGWSGSDEAADGEGGKSKAKPSREIKVEAVRAAVGFAQQTSSRGGAKVTVIYPAERMNAASANTLLKTLEEPPGRARFVLASAAPQRLLPTVRSRCQTLRVPLPAPDVAAGWLAARQVAQPEVLLAAAGGQPLEAHERLALGVDAPAWLRLPREVLAGQAATLAAWPLPLAIDALQKLCHDALAIAVGAVPRYFPADSLPPRGDVAHLTDCAADLRHAARHAEHPWNAGLGVEALVVRVRAALRPSKEGDAQHSRGPALATLKR